MSLHIYQPELRGRAIKVSHGIYSHVGIYDGEGGVVHYTDLSGFKNKGLAGVVYTSLEVFAQGGQPVLLDWEPQFHPEVVMQRAFSRLREQNYSLFNNN